MLFTLNKNSLCTPINTPNDVRNLASNIITYFQWVVQYNNNDYSFVVNEHFYQLFLSFTIVKTTWYDFKGTTNSINVQMICDIMSNNTIGDPLARLAALNSIFSAYFRMSCTDFSYSKYISSLKNASLSSSQVQNGCSLITNLWISHFSFTEISHFVLY